MDWMCEEGENLKYRSEAIHQAVAIYDAYYSIPNIEEIQAKSLIGAIIERKTPEQIN